MALNIKQHSLKKRVDSRGWLVENELDIIRRSMRHFLISLSKPGSIRGQHYHTKKREWFLVLAGQATLVFEDIRSKERRSIRLNQNKPTVVEIPPMVAHAIKNDGKSKMMLLGIVNEHLDPKHRDTFPYKVI